MTVVDKRAMGVSGPGGVRATAAVDSPLSMQVELPWDTSEREIGPRTESELAAACLELIGDEAVLSAAERDLAKGIPASARKRFDIEPIRDAITHGQDPLGAAFSSLRSAALRRTSGAVYTPATITRSIVAWLVEPNRVGSSIQEPDPVASFWLQARLFPAPNSLLSKRTRSPH